MKLVSQGLKREITSEITNNISNVSCYKSAFKSRFRPETATWNCWPNSPSNLLDNIRDGTISGATYMSMFFPKRYYFSQYNYSVHAQKLKIYRWRHWWYHHELDDKFEGELGQLLQIAVSVLKLVNGNIVPYCPAKFAWKCLIHGYYKDFKYQTCWLSILHCTAPSTKSNLLQRGTCTTTFMCPNVSGDGSVGDRQIIITFVS